MNESDIAYLKSLKVIRTSSNPTFLKLLKEFQELKIRNRQYRDELEHVEFEYDKVLDENDMLTAKVDNLLADQKIKEKEIQKLKEEISTLANHPAKNVFNEDIYVYDQDSFSLGI